MLTATPSSAHATATMRANRGRDTAPELALRAALHRRGLRFYKDRRIDLSGGRRVRPDIVFPRLRVAIFLDGCFWHGCRVHRTIPASNTEFWSEKIAATRRRDALQTRRLRDDGWSVLRIWEHEGTDAALELVIAALARARDRTLAGR
jgi:DNA mismatch endonuclease, patch repair protein